MLGGYPAGVFDHLRGGTNPAVLIELATQYIADVAVAQGWTQRADGSWFKVYASLEERVTYSLAPSPAAPRIRLDSKSGGRL